MTASQNSNSNPRLSLPLLQGLLPFGRVRIGPDIVAGITLAALGIPEVMGYTKIIGTPVITGLYTLFLPVLMYALFGSSRHLVASADSATAAMVAAGLTSLSFTANTPKYVALTSLIGLLAASILLLARILRLGFLADFPVSYRTGGLFVGCRYSGCFRRTSRDARHREGRPQRTSAC